MRQAALGESCSPVAEAPVFSKAVAQDESLKSPASKEETEEGKIERSNGNESLKSSAKEENETENANGETKNKRLDEIRENIANAAQESSFPSFFGFHLLLVFIKTNFEK